MAIQSATVDRSRQLKIGAAAVCLLVASVLLAHSFGVITLWGGLPPAPKLTVAEESRVQQLMKDAAATRAQNAAQHRTVNVGGQ